MASAWWPICTAGPTTTSWTGASPSSSAWPTAAPRGPRSRRATAPASWCRSRTASCRRAAEDGRLRAARRRGLRGRPRLPARPTPTTRRRPAPWSSRPPAEEGLTRAGLAHGARPSPTASGTPPRGAMPRIRAALRGAGRRPGVDTMALERRAFVLRKRAEHAVDGLYFPSLSARTHRLQGHAHLRAAAPVLPRPARPDLRVGPGARALALLDQHVPELAAGPPVPLPLPQRRDQHAGRQPQLDARPRGAARDVARSRATCRASTRSARRGRATRPASTRCSSCCTSAGARCRTPC